MLGGGGGGEGGLREAVGDSGRKRKIRSDNKVRGAERGAELNGDA